MKEEVEVENEDGVVDNKDGYYTGLPDLRKKKDLKAQPRSTLTHLDKVKDKIKKAEKSKIK